MCKRARLVRQPKTFLLSPWYLHWGKKVGLWVILATLLSWTDILQFSESEMDADFLSFPRMIPYKHRNVCLWIYHYQECHCFVIVFFSSTEMFCWRWISRLDEIWFLMEINKILFVFLAFTCKTPIKKSIEKKDKKYKTTNMTRQRLESYKYLDHNRIGFGVS